MSKRTANKHNDFLVAEMLYFLWDKFYQPESKIKIPFQLRELKRGNKK